MSTAAQPAATPSLFRHAAFRKIWMAQFVSVFGDFLALFGIISFITFRLHGDPRQVTGVTVGYILPLAIIGPFIGVLVDHWDVRRVMIASDAVRSLLALSLVWVHDVRQIGIILFCISVISTMFIPAQSIAIRTLVPPERLLSANAMLSQAFYLIRIASPLAAGALIGALGERACFFIDAGSFAFSALMIATLTIVRPPREGADKTLRGLSSDFLAGNRFIFTHAGLSFVFLAMAAAMFVLSSFSPLISIFVRDILHAGPIMYGIVSSTIGVGLIVGTTLLTKIAGKKPQPKTVLYGLAILGLATVVLAVAQHAPLAAFSMFVMGSAIAFVIVPAQTMSQQETPPAMVGRVSSTFMAMISVAQVLGLLVSGGLAQKLGMRPLFQCCAVLLLVLAGLGWLWLSKRTFPPSQEPLQSSAS